MLNLSFDVDLGSRCVGLNGVWVGGGGVDCFVGLLLVVELERVWGCCVWGGGFVVFGGCVGMGSFLRGWIVCVGVELLCGLDRIWDVVYGVVCCELWRCLGALAGGMVSIFFWVWR